VEEDAVLNYNYIWKKLEPYLDLPYKSKTFHEVVFSDRDLPVKTLDIAKRLLDFGLHPSTIYFHLIVFYISFKLKIFTLVFYSFLYLVFL
jgi:glycine dehydrogenase subunit 2